LDKPNIILTPDEIRKLELPKLRKEGKFGDFMLVAWGMVEAFIEIGVLYQFGMPNDEVQQDYLSEKPFQKKLDFLRDEKVLDAESYRKIKQFQADRNQLFHPSETLLIRIAREEEQNKIMDNAEQAFDAGLDIFARWLKTQGLLQQNFDTRKIWEEQPKT